MDSRSRSVTFRTDLPKNFPAAEGCAGPTARRIFRDSTIPDYTVRNVETPDNLLDAFLMLRSYE